MLVAGEASGDLHGAALCRALRAHAPGARLFGMGGRQMAAAGMRLLAEITDTAVVGLSEVVRRLPALRRTYRRLVAALRNERPAALVLIDYPGMNLRLAAVARSAGVPVVYFVPPQIWAWRAGRAKAMRRSVSLVLAVFPFERALYQSAGVPSEFVGHPVLDALPTAPTRNEARAALGVDPDELLIGLLPGSRRQEIDRLTPLLRDAAGQIAASRPRARFALALAPTIERAHVERHLNGGPPIRLVDDATYAVMRAADLLLVTSGTATLEAALLGTPMIVCYRVSLFTELMGRLLVRIPWISLANIVLGRAVVPELCQRREVTAERVAREALALLAAPAALEAQRQAFGELSEQLGQPGVGDRAARLVLAVARAAV